MLAYLLSLFLFIYLVFIPLVALLIFIMFLFYLLLTKFTIAAQLPQEADVKTWKIAFRASCLPDECTEYKFSSCHCFQISRKFLLFCIYFHTPLALNILKNFLTLL